jgi:hypothetical protein
MALAPSENKEEKRKSKKDLMSKFVFIWLKTTEINQFGRFCKQVEYWPHAFVLAQLNL